MSLPTLFAELHAIETQPSILQLETQIQKLEKSVRPHLACFDLCSGP